MRNLILLLLTLSSVYSIAQEKYTISGYVKDANDGEDLYGANVYEKESFKGVSTNFYGFYSLTLPAGTYVIRYSSLGYDIIEKNNSKTIAVAVLVWECQSLFVHRKAPYSQIVCQ